MKLTFVVLIGSDTNALGRDFFCLAVFLSEAGLRFLLLEVGCGLSPSPSSGVSVGDAGVSTTLVSLCLESGACIAGLLTYAVLDSLFSSL